MTIINGDFPFEEIRQEGGDFFDTIEQAIKATGCSLNNVWVVIEAGEDSVSYCPPHHFINRLGYVVTAELHDSATYYDEPGVN